MTKEELIHMLITFPISADAKVYNGAGEEIAGIVTYLNTRMEPKIGILLYAEGKEER